MEEQRYPISVRLIGVMHKEKSKMYMTSVLWSDQNDIVVYRTFVEFKRMHKELKRSFPPARKLDKSDRVVPRFRDKTLKTRRGKKGPKKSLLRLQFLQKYCNDLLSSDLQVTQSPVIIKFFHPSDQDLQPEFSKNSIMVMPSEDDSKNMGPVNSGTVTQPFVTETYRCVAPYEVKDTKNKPFKVAVDEKVDVLIKDKAGWWLVENEEKRLAWFPAPYLEKLEEDEDEDDADEIPERGLLYTAIKSYKATKDDEISVTIGAVVEVLQKSDNGWWLIRYNGKAGFIPTMYLQTYNFPHIRMTTNHQQRRHSSQLQLPPPSFQPQNSGQLSRSQGNLLQPPRVRSPSPNPHQPAARQRSQSLNLLSQQPPPLSRPPPPAPHSRPATAMRSPPPTIMVEMDGEEEEDEERRQGSPTSGSEGSFSSDSDFSFSDDLSSSSASSTLNLSHVANEENIRLSRTPPPPASNHLSPTSGHEGRIMPSLSDPTIYKSASVPKVPPRPRAQEILTRCTTITRKNAARRSPSPSQAEILGR